MPFEISLDHQLTHQFVTQLVNHPQAQIQEGDFFPESPCFFYDQNDPKKVIESSLRGFMGERTAVVVTIPGPYTPVCTSVHIPEYLKLVDRINALGYELIVLAPSSPDGMRAWFNDLINDNFDETNPYNSKSAVEFLATDFDAPYQMGVGMEGHSGRGLGYTFMRGAIIVVKGKVEGVYMEIDPANMTVSKADNIYQTLSKAIHK